MESLLSLNALLAFSGPSLEIADLTVGKVVFQWSVIFFLVLLNGFFVASEFAIVKVRRSQLDTLAEGGQSRMADSARTVTKNLDGYLSATQLGITVASIALGMLGEPYIAGMLRYAGYHWFGFSVEMLNSNWMHTVSLGIAFGLVTFLHIVLGELTPKSLAIRKSLGTTLWISRPLQFFYNLFRPAIWILNGAANWLLRVVCRVDPVTEDELSHTAEELRMIVKDGKQSAEFTQTERDLVINALELDDLVVRDIMTPRNEAVCLDPALTFDQNLAKAIESKHTRFPLVKGHIDETIGMIHIKDLLTLVGSGAPNLLSVKKELQPVPEMLPLDKLLKFFLSHHAHLAVVVDEFGGAVGIVTMEDVLEELVGDIQDEFDQEEKEFQRISDSEFLVQGSLALYELEDHCDLSWASPDVSTVGGFVTHRFGHLPELHETVEIDGYRVTIEKTDGRRVLQVRMKRTGSGTLGSNGAQEAANGGSSSNGSGTKGDSSPSLAS